MSPPPVAICSNWARELQSGCCGASHKMSDYIWSITNSSAIKYVWSTSHQKSGSNVVVLRAMLFMIARKQLSSSLNQLGHCNTKNRSCVAENRVHFWDVGKC